MNPIDEALEYSKTAAWRSPRANMRKMVGAVGNIGKHIGNVGQQAAEQIPDAIKNVMRNAFSRNNVGAGAEELVDAAGHSDTARKFVEQMAHKAHEAADARGHDVRMLGRKARYDKAVNGAKAVQEANLGLRNAIVAPLALGAAAAGAGAVAYGGLKLQHAMTAKSDFDKMLNTNPHLQEYHDRDPKFFNDAFSSARNAAPHMMGNPMMAGHLMSSMMATDRSAAGSVLATAMQNEAVMRRDRGIGLGPIAFKPPV